MRRVRYAVAMSLDGYIAGPNGEADWITSDSEIDFTSIFKQFDTILVGRRTFENMAAAGQPSLPGMKTVVFSRTLKARDYPKVLIVSEGEHEKVAALKADSGKDIWLFGGASLFGSLAQHRLVDTVEVTVVPVLLGAGTPLMTDASARVNLSLSRHRVYKTGLVSLEYTIRP